MLAIRAMLAAALACLAPPVAAQVVERHLPPAPAAPAIRAAEAALPAETDDRAFGPRLTGILLLGSDQAAGSVAGVRITGFTPPREAALVKALTKLLGRPLSRKLIADAVATVTRSYRAADRPLVSVTTPEQDLTEGVLRLQVVEFLAGRLATRAPNGAVAAAIARGIRFPPGERIDARRLRQDLNWLDHYPFRRTNPVFSPGADPGTSDLTLNVVPRRPWQVFAGIFSSDAPTSGDVRVFGGVVAGDVLGRGSLVSAQATASGFDDPRYWSVAARLIEPLGPRHELSALVAHVRGRTALAPIATRADTTEAAVELRFALPPALLGDAHLGIEIGHQRVDARFGGLPLYRNRATTVVAVARYSVTMPITSGVLAIDVAVHASLGGFVRANTADRLFFGRPRGGSATYAYLTADIAVERVLAGVLSWRGRMIVQASAAPLPALDQAGLGGTAYVRGYTLDDGGYDRVVIVRNAFGAKAGRIAPYAFADWGHGRDEAARRTATVESIGVGVGRTLGPLRIVAEAAFPLLSGPCTAAGHPRLLARADMMF